MASVLIVVAVVLVAVVNSCPPPGGNGVDTEPTHPPSPLVAKDPARTKVIEDVRAGHLTLAEGVREMRLLNAVPPAVPDSVYNYYPGATLEERVARNLILRIQMVTPESERDAITRRLEAEIAGWTKD
ncbi:hypothetical protein FRUB_10249 [Fimbriiglobus ruber]|uniref:Uncharacterized protein n=2 Tax=Fimbriiglobus ruber TaxID=1908690 RepID=A0A225D6X2_9BACT|nr:hypothetical protein FRUB_10249 [Fimbriiglobus ruber]